MKKHFILTALAALLCGVAVAQVPNAPLVTSLGQNDVVQVIPNGIPSAPSVYAYAGQVAGVDEYSFQTPTTGFSITVPNATSVLYLNPAGTLATGTITMMASPSDGQRFCLLTSQTQTAVTMTANTGQSFYTTNGALATPTALMANTRYCWFYAASKAAWVRTL